MKKLTYQFVKEQFEKEGYELLSTEYINNSQKLKYICSQGHRHEISWRKWNSGRRCPYCAGLVKLSIDYVRCEFEKEDYILLTKKYENNSQKLEYVCPKGHRHSICWGNWSQGQRCPYCVGRPPLTIDFVRSEFEKYGYKLLSTEYINDVYKLEYICPAAHKNSMSWGNFRNGKRCPTCFHIGNSGSGNCNWKGGISCEPYCDAWTDKEYKESILERDNYECQNPNCWGTSKRLTIHHINYNKKNCKPLNLITLCNSCNARANFNRKQHMLFYKTIMEKKYKINQVNGWYIKNAAA